MSITLHPQAITQAASAEPTDAPAITIAEPMCAVFRRQLKGVGLKYTPERAQILDAVVRRDGVFEADELLREMKDRGFRVSKATIYRTLKLLQDAGIIEQVLFDAEQAHYQLAYARATTGLVVNTDTGRVTAVEVPELRALRERLCAELGLAPVGHRLVIYACEAR